MASPPRPSRRTFFQRLLTLVGAATVAPLAKETAALGVGGDPLLTRCIDKELTRISLEYRMTEVPISTWADNVFPQYVTHTTGVPMPKKTAALPAIPALADPPPAHTPGDMQDEVLTIDEGVTGEITVPGSLNDWLSPRRGPKVDPILQKPKKGKKLAARPSGQLPAAGADGLPGK